MIDNASHIGLARVGNSTTTPTAWIQEECYPPGFKWADPSKIRLNNVHDLLIYWRQRKEDGLAPLIWNPSCELLAGSDVEKTSEHLPARRWCQNASTSNVDDDEENYAQELNNITDNSSVLQLPPPPHSLHPVQRGPAGSDTEASFNVERSDNMQPSEPTPTELTHNPARAQSNPQQTPSQSMAHPQRDHGGPVASTSGHVPENQPPQPHTLGKQQIKVTPKARGVGTTCTSSVVAGHGKGVGRLRPRTMVHKYHLVSRDTRIITGLGRLKRKGERKARDRSRYRELKGTGVVQPIEDEVMWKKKKGGQREVRNRNNTGRGSERIGPNYLGRNT
ncbi:hypothetical protein EDB85DRAFT_1891555 [Lactarius pseudohatsudake]|nr:hypothetical protein EDB85DRAFT_1891555 [Lactarius pseudohatsudake]